MSNGKHTEARFEDAIELELLAYGYSKRDRAHYDTKRGIFPDDVIVYVQASQPKKWQSLADLQGDAAQETLIDDPKRGPTSARRCLPCVCRGDFRRGHNLDNPLI